MVNIINVGLVFMSSGISVTEIPFRLQAIVAKMQFEKNEICS
ncbi:hypothetical protein [Bartonella gliris]